MAANGAKRSRTGAAALAVTMIAVASPAPAGAAPVRPCGPPTLVLVATGAPDPSLPGYGRAPGSPEPFVTFGGPGLDMDGDGEDDTVSRLDDTVAVVRGDGVLAVTDVPANTHVVGTQGGGAPWGTDLDGDGGDELVFVVAPNFPTSAPAGHAVVPSATPLGTVSLEDAAVRWVGRLGADVTGDGLDDVLVQAVGPGPPVLPVSTWVSLRGSLAPGDTTWQPFAELTAYGDVDHDGRTDRAFTTWRAGTDDPPQRGVVLSGRSPDLLPLSGTGRLAFATDGRQHYVWSSVTPDPGSTVAVHRVRAACAAPWMGDLARHLVGRSAAPSDYWGVDPASEPSDIVRSILAAVMAGSDEARTHLVRERYRWILGREGDAAGVRYWAGALQRKVRTAEQLTASLLASNEFFRKAGGTTDAWIEAVYQSQLGRSSDPEGLRYWRSQVARSGRERAARLFLSSTGTRRERVRHIYADLLHRAPDARELSQGIAIVGTDGEEGFTVRLARSWSSYVASQVHANGG